MRAPNGQIVCRSTLTYANNGCVPMNVFGVGSPSQASIDWITQDISQKQLVQQSVADVSMSGRAFDNWAGAVAAAFGVSWRHDWFTQDVYPVELHELDMPASTVGLGYKGLPSVYVGQPRTSSSAARPAAPSGGYTVKEAFAEVQMPLLGETSRSRGPWISNTAVRLADYEGSGNVWAWKGGLDWSVNDEVRLRLTRSRDIRAGTLSERFDTSRGPGNIVRERRAAVRDQPRAERQPEREAGAGRYDHLRLRVSAVLARGASRCRSMRST